MNDIAAVLLIFFNRPDTLELVFEQIKKCQPHKLYLFCDGARENNLTDVDNISKCQKIVSDINWDCKAYKYYSEKNLGCGEGPYAALKWFFENEDEGIILEDDCIPSQSFFSFCTSMLRKYRYDERFFLISGCNFELETKYIESSYFFGYAGTNWGWASWRRNWDKMDYACSWVKDSSTVYNVKSLIKNISKTASKKEIELFKRTNELVEKGIKISYWDIQWQAIRYLNHQFSIIPSKNLITNIGVGGYSTHAHKVEKPKEYYSHIGKVHFWYNKRFEFCNDLISPKRVVQNFIYDKKIYRKLYPSFFYKIMSYVLRFLHIS